MSGESKHVYKPIKIRKDVYEKLKMFKRMFGAHSISETIETLMQTAVTPPKIRIRVEELNEALSTESSRVVDGEEAYLIVLKKGSSILDGRGETYELRYSVAVDAEDRTIYVVGKKILEGKALLLVEGNRAIGVKFKNGKHEEFLRGEISI